MAFATSASKGENKKQKIALERNLCKLLRNFSLLFSAREITKYLHFSKATWHPESESQGGGRKKADWKRQDLLEERKLIFPSPQKIAMKMKSFYENCWFPLLPWRTFLFDIFGRHFRRKSRDFNSHSKFKGSKHNHAINGVTMASPIMQKIIKSTHDPQISPQCHSFRKGRKILIYYIYREWKGKR